jgi:hypothetical protein
VRRRGWRAGRGTSGWHGCWWLAVNNELVPNWCPVTRNLAPRESLSWDKES